MNKIEALRKEADLREMCEGTTVQWWECMKGFAGKCMKGFVGNICPNEHYAYHWLSELNENRISYALAIVENKPVFVGDELYYNGEKVAIDERYGGVSYKSFAWKSYSWNPPRPKTVMVELLVEDAEWYVANTVVNHRLGEACRKALEKLK